MGDIKTAFRSERLGCGNAGFLTPDTTKLMSPPAGNEPDVRRMVITSDAIVTVPWPPGGDMNEMDRGVNVQSPQAIPSPTSVMINDDPS